MDAGNRLLVINQRIAEAHAEAAERRLAALAESRDSQPRPPRGPLAWLVRAGAATATGLAGAIVVLRLA